jgi:hypothetical protein
MLSSVQFDRGCSVAIIYYGEVPLSYQIGLPVNDGFGNVEQMSLSHAEVLGGANQPNAGPTPIQASDTGVHAWWMTPFIVAMFAEAIAGFPSEPTTITQAAAGAARIPFGAKYGGYA